MNRSLCIRSVLLVVVLSLIMVTVLPAQEKGKGRKNRKSGEEKTMIDAKAATEVFINATKARILGDYATATTLYQQCLELDPRNDAAMYELAQLQFSKGDYAESVRLIEQAIEIDPENEYYRLLSIEIYGKSGRKDDLLRTCQQLVKKYPENVDYLYELASAYLLHGKADEAIKTYNSIENIMGVNEEVSLQKHRIYLLMEKPEKAVREIEALVETYPDQSSRYYAMLAEIYMQQNKPDEAAEYYRKIIESDPDNPYVHISLSDYYRKKSDFARSLEELRKGFANPGLDVETKLRILMAYYGTQEIYTDKKAEVEDLTNVIVNAHPGDAKALSLKADLLLQDQDYSGAREIYRRILAIDSSRYSVWEGLLQANASLSDWEALSRESNRALDLFPFQPLPYLFNGIARMQLKEIPGAIKTLTAGSRLVTSNDALLLQFYTYLGDAYNQDGQHALSDESYEKVLKKDPENAYVLNNYAYYLSLRGVNLDKALIMAEKAAALDSLNPANLDTYGWVLYKLGRYDEAEKWIGKAMLASTKDDPDILEHYGDIQFMLGKVEKASEYWIRAKNANGGSTFLEKKIKEKKLYE